MKKALICTIFLIISALAHTLYAQDGGAWDKITNYPSLNGLYGQVTNVVNGKAYITFGIDKNNVISTDMYEFNPVGTIWTKKQSFPGTPRYGSTSFAVSDTIYYLDGSTGPGTPRLYEFWAYSISGDSWTEKENLVRYGRTCATGFSINGKGYIYGGTIDSTSYLNDIWEYEPTSGSWTSLPSIPLSYGRIGASAFVINGKAYICGGKNKAGAYLGDTWEFEPIQWSWVQKASRPAGSETTFGTAFTMDRASTSKGYYGLGSNASQPTNDFPVSTYEYDLNTDTWELINDFPASGRSNSISFVIANTAYVGAGASDMQQPVYEKDIWSLTMQSSGSFASSISGIIHEDTSFLKKGKVIAFHLGTEHRYSVFTNDIGEFVFHSLPQGKYLLKAIPNPGDTFTSTFYPNKIDSLDGVTVTLGDPISGIDLYMLSTKTDTNPGEITFGDFNIYPNPCEKSINVISLNKDAVFLKIQISNIIGALQHEIIFEDKLNSYSIDLENVKQGVYILKVESSAGTYIKKIIKQ